ncbi:outer membrane protein [Bradyrhizobium erythrophlei]|jgi:opacity protein-like surface antigen|uniref:Opacity protein n=1 Tax=Bradyrhizobium erythrophlei TaxID=1437360 RepID=A0A1M7TA19_9BRAD|nr:outer membrane beta-barrel protein [Bradyrhizobium erythrophlei]SHN67517.1 Opacity protein [Bradyrhizobium erythrophlei]
MRSVKIFVVAGAASLLSSMAFAADMAIAPPPMSYGPPPAADFGGWYLRGDIGFSNQRVDNIRNTNAALYTGLTSFQEKTGFDTGGIYQIGAGYQFNHWFRVDVTGEYRGSTNFHGLDLIGFPGGFGADTYNASKSEWLFLANAYADLGTWWCITPYVGAGIGTARVAISNFTDTGINNSGAGATPSLVTAANGSQWNFAWALHAGLAYKVNPNMAVELGYSYVNLGNGTTGVDSAFDNSVGGHVFQFHNITSHDVKLGVRWNLDSPPAYVPPLVTKG